MFYASQSNIDTVRTALGGDGVTCYSAVNMPGRFPVFMLEIPDDDKDAQIFSQPLLCTSLEILRPILDQLQKSIAALNVSMIYPGWLSDKGANNWQCGQIDSILQAHWQENATGSRHSTVRFVMKDGTRVDLLNHPDRTPDGLDWKKLY